MTGKRTRDWVKKIYVQQSRISESKFVKIEENILHRLHLQYKGEKNAGFNGKFLLITVKISPTHYSLLTTYTLKLKT